jgi:predicted RNA binding protein YcfA (HicA-like mRNA interferase family)
MGRKKHSNKRRDVERQLRDDGWEIVRKGAGDHTQWKHSTKEGRVTLDTSESDIPTGTLRSIYRQAGWEW